MDFSDSEPVVHIGRVRIDGSLSGPTLMFGQRQGAAWLRINGSRPIEIDLTKSPTTIILADLERSPLPPWARYCDPTPVPPQAF